MPKQVAATHYVETANSDTNATNNRLTKLRLLKTIAGNKLIYLYKHVYYGRAQEINRET